MKTLLALLFWFACIQLAKASPDEAPLAEKLEALRNMPDQLSSTDSDLNSDSIAERRSYIGRAIPDGDHATPLPQLDEIADSLTLKSREDVLTLIVYATDRSGRLRYITLRMLRQNGLIALHDEFWSLFRELDPANGDSLARARWIRQLVAEIARNEGKAK